MIAHVPAALALVVAMTGLSAVGPSTAVGPALAVPGGETSLVALVFLGRTAAFALACWIAYRTARGYRRARAPALVWLAIGIAFLAAVPTAARFLLPTLFGTASLTTAVIAGASEVVGLLAILYAVYGEPR